MRTRIEAVLNNNDAKAQDYFDLVNIYEYSQVTLHRDGNSILSQVNLIPTLQLCSLQSIASKSQSTICLKLHKQKRIKI